jgi:hypothetical protein
MTGHHTLFLARRAALSMLGVALLGALAWGVDATVAGAQPALPATCTGGTLAAGNYVDLTVSGSCTITSGTVTVRDALTVTGSGSLSNDPGTSLVVARGVSLQSQSTLQVTNAQVHGGVQGNLPTTVQFDSSAVSGGIHVVGGVVLEVSNSTVSGNITQRRMASPGSSQVDHSSVSGDIDIANGNVRAGAAVLDNNVTGSVRVSRLGSISYLPSTISGNTITGNLACRGDDPAPTNGGAPNKVARSELAQCVGL